MRRKVANERIRREAKKKGVCLWEIADLFGVADCTFSRKLRKEFSKEDTEKAWRYIDEIAAGREAVG